MGDKKLTSLFEKFLEQNNLFSDRKALQANYTPSMIYHRDEQIHQLAGILMPSLRLQKPSNIFVYGKTGSGKTLSVHHTTKNLIEVAAKQQTPLKVLYINCKLKKVADTEYRLITQIARELGQEAPATGLPTQEIYQLFTSTLDSKEQLLILVLDEIDQLIKKAGDEILYTLTRINTELKRSQVALIGISNDLLFADHLDPRIKSSLSEEEIIFPPYNALQIRDILQRRASIAFREGVLEGGVIEKCAAYAAREHGDARRAIELLRVAGEIAERNEQGSVSMHHLDEAEEKIERERIFDVISSQPEQCKITLYALLSIFGKQKPFTFTGEIYDKYKYYCSQTGFRPLTQRRISDVIAELDMLGVINTRVLSKGRYGRTREIHPSIPQQVIERIMSFLEKELNLKQP